MKVAEEPVDGVWEQANLRTFLMGTSGPLSLACSIFTLLSSSFRITSDLQSVSGLPRIATDEVVDAVWRELQLTADSAGRLSWIEWKSFLVLQSERPLAYLTAKLQALGVR